MDGAKRRSGRAAVAGLFTLLPLLGAGSAGCLTPDVKPNLNDPDPSIKVPAIKGVASADETAADQSAAVGPLIDDLSSDDPAVRLFAAEGLRRITGESFGYEPYLDPEPRAAAVERWKQWSATRVAADGRGSDGRGSAER